MPIFQYIILLVIRPIYNFHIVLRGLLLCLLLFTSCLARTNKEILAKPEYTLDFEYINHFIVVKLQLNDVFVGNFIFDTGAQFTMLNDPLVQAVCNIKLERSIAIVGSDRNIILEAYRTNLIKMKLGDYRPFKRKVIFLHHKEIDFSPFVGMPIHGILGADILVNRVFRIDFQNMKISFYRHEDFIVPTQRETVDIDLEKGRPFLYSTFLNHKSNNISLRLLLDTGASVSFILNESEGKGVEIPENVIPTKFGTGLGGELNGFLSRAKGISFGENTYGNMLFYYQRAKLDTDGTTSLVKRDGLIGNRFLSNFDLIIDLAHKKMYIKQRKKINFGENENTSGIIVLVTGEDQNIVHIESVIKNSPADKIGLQKGWKILSINGISVGSFQKELIFSKFESKVGKTLRLKVDTGSEKRIFKLKTQKLL